MNKIRICSFDIGIKNLAYCLMEKENNNISIIDWGILNLTDNLMKCSHIRGSKECNKRATYYYENEGIKNGLCSCHSKKFKKIIFTKIPKKNNKICECEKEARWVYDEKFYCDEHKKNLKSTHKLHKINLSYSNEDTMYKLASTMAIEIDTKIPDINLIDFVIIENQPAFINPTMKSIASFVYMHFVDLMYYKYNKKIHIQFISALNKLKLKSLVDIKLYKNPSGTEEEIIKPKIKNKYKETKMMGIEICKEIIKKTNINNLLIEIFNNHKKKDDLSDALLQGYWFLTN